jgi:hypothetical protein
MMCRSSVVEVVSKLKIHKTVTMVDIISGLTASTTEPRHILLQIIYFKVVNNFKAVNKY